MYSNQEYTDATLGSYPLTEKAFTYFEKEILEKINVYKLDKKWKGIEYISSDVISGDEEMPRGLSFTGSSEMNGNDGDGYAIIRKVG